MTAKLNTQDRAGFVFDRYGDESFKYIAIDADADRLIIAADPEETVVLPEDVVAPLAPVDETLGLFAGAVDLAGGGNDRVVQSGRGDAGPMLPERPACSQEAVPPVMAAIRLPAPGPTGRRPGSPPAQTGEPAS